MREEKNIHIRKPYHTPLVEFEKVENDSLMDASQEGNVDSMQGNGNDDLDLPGN